MKTGDILECSIESLAFGGRGIARVEGKVLFVERTLPKQTVQVQITKSTKRFAEARPVNIIKQSADFEEPFCKHFGECGGCLHQDMKYEAQLREKVAQLEDIMQRIGHLNFAHVKPILPSPKQRFYRNKMEFAFSGTGKGLALGLRERGTKKVLNINSCQLMTERSLQMLQEARALCRESGIPAYNPKSKEGFWRHLVLRESAALGTCLVHLITASGRRYFKAAEMLGRYLCESLGLDCFVHSTRKSAAELAFGEWEVLELGGRRIEEQLNVGGHEIRYAISPNAFFQPNTGSATLLYQTVLDFAALQGTESVLDLYCGCGGISLALAAQAGNIVGLESVKSAVDDAEYNASLNGTTNCKFSILDIEKEARALQAYAHPELLILDPPRGGLHPKVVDAIKLISPKRIIAVSCDPPALARDIARLQYMPKTLQAIDQFPHTPHIECVALLERA